MAVAGSRIRHFIRKARLPLVAALVGMLDVPAQAQRIENMIADFAALDKVTANVRQLHIALNQTKEFRSLKITPRVCFTRDPKEPPRTSTFVEVDEVLFDGTVKRVFTGWMFAESPGLNPLVHPVFDLWLTGCSRPQRAPAGKGWAPETTAPPPGEPPLRRRRVPR